MCDCVLLAGEFSQLAEPLVSLLAAGGWRLAVLQTPKGAAESVEFAASLRGVELQRLDEPSLDRQEAASQFARTRETSVRGIVHGCTFSHPLSFDLEPTAVLAKSLGANLTDTESGSVVALSFWLNGNDVASLTLARQARTASLKVHALALAPKVRLNAVDVLMPAFAADAHTGIWADAARAVAFALKMPSMTGQTLTLTP